MDPASKELLGGLIAGSVNVLSGFPFDTIKVRLQSDRGLYAGAFDCLRKTLRHEGVGGLYRGLSAPLIGGALETGVNYLVYSRVMHLLSAAAQTSGGSSGRGRDTSGSVPAAAASLPHLAQVPIAAAAAGLVLSFVLAPFELIKMTASLYRGPWHCLQSTIRQEGLKGLTRGMGATVMREVPGNAIFFTAYEVLRQALPGRAHLPADSAPEQPRHAAGDEKAPPTYSGKDGPGRQALDRQAEVAPPAATGNESSSLALLADAASSVTCGGLAGIIMWAAVLPLDVAKTRLQAAQPGTSWDVGVRRHLAMLWQEGGMRSLYAGASPTLIRAFPANAAQWLAWEAAMRSIPSSSGASTAPT